jgi:SOS-response transcriptional repressor LexA
MNRIKILRKTLGLTQEKFAERIGVLGNTIGRYEIGIREPSDAIIISICREFRVNESWLLHGSGEMFVKTPTTIIDTLAADFKLDKIDRLIVEEYLKLDEPQKNAIKHYLTRLGDSIYINEASDENNEAGDTFDALSDISKAILFDEETVMHEMKVYNEAAAAGLGNYLSGDDMNYESLLFPASDIPRGSEFGIRISGDSMEPNILNGSIVWVKGQPVVENGEVGIFILDGSAYCKRLRIDHEQKAVYLDSFNKAYEPIKVIKADDLRTIGKVLGRLVKQ